MKRCHNIHFHIVRIVFLLPLIPLPLICKDTPLGAPCHFVPQESLQATMNNIPCPENEIWFNDEEETNYHEFGLGTYKYQFTLTLPGELSPRRWSSAYHYWMAIELKDFPHLTEKMAEATSLKELWGWYYQRPPYVLSKRNIQTEKSIAEAYKTANQPAIMKTILSQRLEEYPQLKLLLLGTGTKKLKYISTDPVLGRFINSEQADDWVGENLVGETLEKIREELRRKEPEPKVLTTATTTSPDQLLTDLNASFLIIGSIQK